MSFTLNGEPYADYMFEYGSDYENIIIKVNVGEALGIIDYTIDAIQYADRDVLKYVEMQGDPTVSIGVYGDTMPVQSVSDENIGINDIELKINVEPAAFEDEKIEGLSIIIEDDEKIVAEKELKIGENTVKLEGLLTGTEYRYAIVMKLISQNGENKSYILAEKRFKTQEALTFEFVSLTDEAVSFEIKWNEIFKGTKAFTSLTLYIGDIKVRNIDVDATTIDGLSPDMEYTIVAQYVNAVEESCEFIFKTKVKMVGYTVNHHIENINDTNYTLYETESLKESQNTEVTPDVKSYEGFNSPEKQTLTVKPDGSLVVDYYYTRNSYTITFVTNGGDAILTQTLKYEAEIPTLPNAVRDSDTFGGWFTDAKLTTAFTIQKMGSSNITLYAYWEGETKPGSFTYSGSSEIKITKFTGTEWDVVIPEYIAGKPVKTIGIKAFENSEIVSVVIPDTVTRLENLVFNFCYDLEHVTMGSGVKYIGDYIFNGVNDGANYILNIYITDLEAWCNISHGKRDNTQKNLYLNGELLEELIIPENITKIGDRTFDNIKSLKSVIIHDGVTSIGSSAFSVCDGLVSVTIGNGVTSIGSSAFSCCVGLTSITIPDNVTSIGDSAFYSCRRLASVTIGNGVTSIGDEAFYDCYYLSSLTIGKGVQRIGKSAFYCCRNLSTVQFEGTKGEWENISKGTNWRKSANIYIINCTDGDIIVE